MSSDTESGVPMLEDVVPNDAITSLQPQESKQYAVPQMVSQSIIHLYRLENYTLASKDPRIDKDHSTKDRFRRLEKVYHEQGMRRVVEGVLLVHQHGYPHILLLQIGHSFFKLPGGRLRYGEDERKGLLRKLSSKLSLPEAQQPQWETGLLIAQWWRPTFEPRMFPYVPAHVSAPKENRKIFLVPLPEGGTFFIPQNMQLVAVPLHELYDNAVRYGSVIATLPSCLSRFSFNCM
jgi:cleavage and polyadenylation specificity factor subunit 5